YSIEIIACPIVREADGLAMSSRNVYLSAVERKQALVLRRALEAVEDAFGDELRNPAKLRQIAAGVFQKEPAVVVDYIEIVDPETLEPITGRITSAALVAVSAKIAGTRL